MSLKNLLIILAVGVVVTYVFIAVNERQKEHAIRLRLPKFRKIDKYEFDKALYQAREIKGTKRTPQRRYIEQRKEEVKDTKEDFYKDYQYLEELKNSPSTEAQPIQEPNADYYEQQQLQQQQLQQQPVQQDNSQQGQENQTQQQLPQQQLQQQQLQQQQLQQQQLQQQEVESNYYRTPLQPQKQ